MNTNQSPYCLPALTAKINGQVRDCLRVCPGEKVQFELCIVEDYNSCDPNGEYNIIIDSIILTARNQAIYPVFNQAVDRDETGCVQFEYIAKELDSAIDLVYKINLVADNGSSNVLYQVQYNQRLVIDPIETGESPEDKLTLLITDLQGNAVTNLCYAPSVLININAAIEGLLNPRVTLSLEKNGVYQKDIATMLQFDDEDSLSYPFDTSGLENDAHYCVLAKLSWELDDSGTDPEPCSDWIDKVRFEVLDTDTGQIRIELSDDAPLVIGLNYNVNPTFQSINGNNIDIEFEIENDCIGLVEIEIELENEGTLIINIGPSCENTEEFTCQLIPN